jgi:hypothetical protein
MSLGVSLDEVWGNNNAKPFHVPVPAKPGNSRQNTYMVPINNQPNFYSDPHSLGPYNANANANINVNANINANANANNHHMNNFAPQFNTGPHFPALSTNSGNNEFYPQYTNVNIPIAEPRVLPQFDTRENVIATHIPTSNDNNIYVEGQEERLLRLEQLQVKEATAIKNLIQQMRRELYDHRTGFYKHEMKKKKTNDWAMLLGGLGILALLIITCLILMKLSKHIHHVDMMNTP